MLLLQIERRGLPLTPESLATLPPFSSITFNTDDADGGNCKPEVAKTGLGSSAAMTMAVVAALLHYLDVVKLSSSKDHWERKDVADLDMVHKIAQTAHCIAQGKVGSGFDVSSAVYGSQRYVRFSPEVISSTKVPHSYTFCIEQQLILAYSSLSLYIFCLIYFNRHFISPIQPLNLVIFLQ